MEKNKIIYFSTKFFPPYLEVERLHELQIKIKQTHQAIEHVENNAYDLMVRKQGLANRLRSFMRVVTANDSYTEQFIKGDNCSESGNISNI